MVFSAADYSTRLTKICLIALEPHRAMPFILLTKYLYFKISPQTAALTIKRTPLTISIQKRSFKNTLENITLSKQKKKQKRRTLQATIKYNCQIIWVPLNG